MEIITRSAVVPQSLSDSNYAIGAWAGDTFLSLVADEIKLFRLVRLLDVAFDRLNTTVTATPHLLGG